MIIIVSSILATNIANFFSRSGNTFTAFFVFLAFALLFGFLIKTRGRSYEDKLNTFLDEEHEANSTRKKTIDNSYFFVPSMDMLPFKDYYDFSEILKAQEIVLRKSNLKMIRFNPPKTNIEIKKEFGYANLETITMYEEHFSQFVIALLNWAELLYKVNDYLDSKTILEYCVDIGTEQKKCYNMLADIYSFNKDKESLEHLLNCVDNISISSKHSTWAYINNKLDNLEISKD